MDELVQRLIEKQEASAHPWTGEPVSNRVFAERLGISRQAWEQLKAGKIRPGPRTLRGVMAAFPDLQGLALSLFLTPDASKEAEAATVGAEAVA